VNDEHMTRKPHDRSPNRLVSRLRKELGGKWSVLGPIFSVGLVCLLSAVLGGAVKAFGVELPAAANVFERATEGILGAALISFAIWLLVIGKPPDEPEPKVEARSVEIEVDSAVDLELFVDGDQVLHVDHSGGFARGTGQAAIRPDSVLTFRARRLTIEKKAAAFMPEQGRSMQIRVGAESQSNIRLNDQQMRQAMGTKADIPKLVSTLNTATDYSARAWAAERLGYIGGPDAVSALIKALKDPNEWVMAQAAEALGRVGDPSASQPISDAYDSYTHKNRYGYILENAIDRLKFPQNEQ
jgi:hypothetical protein